jgi:hypothetical protein
MKNPILLFLKHIFRYIRPPMERSPIHSHLDKDVEHDEVGLGVVQYGLHHRAVVLVGGAVELFRQVPLVVWAETGGRRMIQLTSSN